MKALFYVASGCEKGRHNSSCNGSIVPPRAACSKHVPNSNIFIELKCIKWHYLSFQFNVRVFFHYTKGIERKRLA